MFCTCCKNNISENSGFVVKNLYICSLDCFNKNFNLTKLKEIYDLQRFV